MMISCQDSSDRGSATYPQIISTGGNHIIHYSNKSGSFWSAETHKLNNHWSTGYVSHRERLFGEIEWLHNGSSFGRESASINYTPLSFSRSYADSSKESVFMPDHVDGLLVQLKPISSGTVEFRLHDVALADANTDSASVGNAPSKNRSLDSRTEGQQVSISVELSHTLSRFLTLTCDASLFKSANFEGNTIVIRFDNPNTETIKISIAAALDQQSSSTSSRDLLLNEDVYVTKKRERFENLYGGRTFETSNSRLNQAWLWALASFDALNMNETATSLGQGIYAGYPWFQDYWGRDSFIALRALTVTGQYDLASANLTAFLRFQQLDTSSADYGKIPNRVRPDEIIYNTADATPRFIIEADRYVAYSNDTVFAREIFTNIEAAILGTIRYRTDENGLLVHNDADSWMDAVGPKGPYSPRGNRAIDIQALWIDALQASSNLARFTRGAAADSLVNIADQTHAIALESFLRLFRADETTASNENTPHLFDAIGANSLESTQMRPNALFAYHLIPGTTAKAHIARRITERLGTPWGPMSLAADDEWYHPYHKTEPFYEQDASYHNGIVWLWNTGSWIESLIRHGLHEQADSITQNYVDIMLDNVTLGTLPELIDAMPRLGKFASEYPTADEFQHISRLDQMSLKNESNVDASIPALSGTWSQAWSLSEFIRNLTEDYGGLRYEPGHGFVLFPAIPSGWGDVLIERQFAGYELDIRRVQNAETETWLLLFEATDKATVSTIPFMLPQMSEPVLLDLTASEDRYEIRVSADKITYQRNFDAYTPQLAPPSTWKNVRLDGVHHWQLWNRDEHDVNTAVYKSQIRN